MTAGRERRRRQADSDGSAPRSSKDRREVLFVSPMDITGHSGGNIATREIVAAVGRHPGLTLSLVCPEPDGGLPADVDEVTANTWFLPPKPAGTMRWHLRSQLAMAGILRRAYREADPDIVVARVGPSTVLTPLSTVLTQTPYVALIRGTVERNLKFSTVIAQVVRLNALVADECYVAYQEILERYGLESDDGATVFPNAVSPDAFRPIPKQQARASIDQDLPQEAFVVGFVGSLKSRHRVDTLLRAVAALAPTVPAHVLVVGDGPERASLERTVAELGLVDSVTFTGFVPHDELAPYVCSCDVTYGVVDESNPSNPIKCYEYLACERPVVTSATEELAFVDTEGFGVTVGEVTTDTVRDALKSLWEQDEATLVEMGQRGREYVVEHHTWDRLADHVAAAALRA